MTDRDFKSQLGRAYIDLVGSTFAINFDDNSDGYVKYVAGYAFNVTMPLQVFNLQELSKCVINNLLIELGSTDDWLLQNQIPLVKISIENGIKCIVVKTYVWRLAHTLNSNLLLRMGYDSPD